MSDNKTDDDDYNKLSPTEQKQKRLEIVKKLFKIQECGYDTLLKKPLYYDINDDYYDLCFKLEYYLYHIDNYNNNKKVE
jgi:hypothetical protein